MEPTAAESIAEELREQAWQIERNIEGIKGKLSRKDVPEDKKRLLRFNLDKARAALNERQENLSDFMRI